MRTISQTLILLALLVGATTTLFPGDKPDPPVFEALDVPTLNRLGVPVIDLKKDRIYPLSKGFRPERILAELSWISEIRDECHIIGYRWNGATYEIFGELECGFGVIVAMPGDSNAPKDVNGELLFPGKTVIMVDECGAHASCGTNYYLADEDTIRLFISVGEYERVSRGDWDKDSIPDYTLSGVNFSCHRLQPNFMNDYTSYYVYDSERNFLVNMQSLNPPNSSDESIQKLFQHAEKRRQVQDRQGSLTALHSIQKRLPNDANIRRDIKFVELNVPECKKKGLSAPENTSARDITYEWPGYADNAIEGKHGPILDHLRTLPVKQLFSAGLAKILFSDFESSDEYVDCALDYLRGSPGENYCEVDNAEAWFLSGWALQQYINRNDQNGQNEDIATALRKAVELAPTDTFFRDALGEYERISKVPVRPQP